MERNVVDQEGPFKVVAVSAIDWTMWEEQQSMIDVYKTEPLTAVIVGFLVRENDDYIWLTQQIFDDEHNSVRNMICIPKTCIEDRHDFSIGEDEDG